MIALPAILVLGGAVLLAILAIAGMGREATNLAHVADDEYERQGTNWGALLLAIGLAVVLLGAIGAGPLAGLAVFAGATP